jgi:hypothetical protein
MARHHASLPGQAAPSGDFIMPVIVLKSRGVIESLSP